MQSSPARVCQAPASRRTSGRRTAASASPVCVLRSASMSASASASARRIPTSSTPDRPPTNPRTNRGRERTRARPTGLPDDRTDAIGPLGRAPPRALIDSLTPVCIPNPKPLSTDARRKTQATKHKTCKTRKTVQTVQTAPEACFLGALPNVDVAFRPGAHFGSPGDAPPECVTEAQFVDRPQIGPRNHPIGCPHLQCSGASRLSPDHSTRHRRDIGESLNGCERRAGRDHLPAEVQPTVTSTPERSLLSLYHPYDLHNHDPEA